MDIGRIGIWTGVLDAVPSAEAQRLAAELEELGFPTLWIPETVGRDPFVTATLLLSATSQLRVATGIANIYARDAMTMANTQRTLEEAFPGRFLLGLGVSHHHLVDRRPPPRLLQAVLAHGRVPRRHGRRDLPGRRPDRAPADRPRRPRPEDAAPGRRAGRRRPPLLRPRRAHRPGPRDPRRRTRSWRPSRWWCSRPTATRARATARQGMAVYLRAPNYVNNLKRLGFADDDVADGGSDRLVDAIVAWGDADAAVEPGRGPPRRRRRPRLRPGPHPEPDVGSSRRLDRSRRRAPRQLAKSERGETRAAFPDVSTVVTADSDQ